MPPRPAMPPRPRTPVDEQVEIDRVIALSLITVKQDDLRRCQLYGSEETIPKTLMPAGDVSNEMGMRASSSNPNLCHIGNSSDDKKSQSAIIARPRPQATRTQSKDRASPIPGPPTAVPRTTPPVIPPRPDSFNWQSTRPDTSPKQQDQPIPKMPPPRPSNVPSQATRPQSTAMTAPVARSRPQAKATATTDSGSDRPLITLSPPAAKRKDPLDVTDFDIDSLDPLHEKYKPAPSPLITSDKVISKSDVISNSLYQMGVRAPPSPVNDVVPTGPGIGRPQSQNHPISVAMMSQHQQPGTRTSLLGMQPFAKNDATAASGGNFARPAPSGADILSQLMPKPVKSPKFPRHSPQNFTTAKDRDSLTQDGSGEFDLMDFTDDEDPHEYLSLQSFDPLYAIKQIEEREAAEAVEQATERLDSGEVNLQLFPNPLDRFQRKETPNPFPTVNAISTQNILRRSSIPSIEPPYKHYERLKTGDIEKGVKGEEVKGEAVKGHQHIQSDESVELQDPFSVSDLTCALEHKRKKHSKDREAREAQVKEEEKKKEQEKAERSKLLRKKKSVETVEEEGLANPKRMSRGSSYIAKGQVGLVYNTIQYDTI